MSALPQPEPPPSGQPEWIIPRTINAIGEALQGEKRARFYSDVLNAEQGAELNGAIDRWWAEAILGQLPTREKGRADALAGRNLSPLPQRRRAAG